MKKCLLVGLLLMISHSSFAESDRWVYVGTDEEGNKHYIDAKTFNCSKQGICKVWHKKIRPPQNRSDDDELLLSVLDPTMMLEEYNCKNRNVRILNSKVSSTQWGAIAPETIREALYDKVCQR